jgi:hypothetical protein
MWEMHYTNDAESCQQVIDMPLPMIAEVFEIPGQRELDDVFAWRPALAMAAIVIGATLALVVVNEAATGPDPQVQVSS